MWVRDSATCYLPQTQLKYRDIDKLKVKGWKKYIGKY